MRESPLLLTPGWHVEWGGEGPGWGVVPSGSQAGDGRSLDRAAGPQVAQPSAPHTLRRLWEVDEIVRGQWGSGGREVSAPVLSQARPSLAGSKGVKPRRWCPEDRVSPAICFLLSLLDCGPITKPPMAPSFLGAQGWSNGWLAVRQDVCDPQSLNQKELETSLLAGCEAKG